MQNGYVVLVTFVIKPEFRKAFQDAVIENAAASRSREPGCSVFEVSESEDGSQILLYEIYDDQAAFKKHLATDHFRHFDALVESWIADKQITTYRRLAR